MSLKKRVAFTLVLSMVFNFLGSSIAFSETGFKAIGIKDNTKIISSQYKSKNGFKYSKDGDIYTTPAFDFHIFSKEANLNSHTNGNIVTKDLVTNAAFGTNQSNTLHINEENYFMNSANGINNIASDGNIIVGSNVPTSLEDNNNKVNIGINGSGLLPEKSSNVYKETSESVKYIDIDAELENLKVISKLFAENSTSNGVTLSAQNGENQTITVDRNLDNKNYYLNVKASEISNGANKRVINIKIPEGKTLIINVDMSGVDINQLQSLVTVINNHSNSEEVVNYENNVLWNIYDSSAADKLFSTGDKYASVGTSDYFMGTILAPNANIKYGAVNGSIIANKTQQNAQESHKWTFTGHSTELTKGTSATIEATKKLSGKTLEEGMFSFNLLDEKGTVLQTVNNDKEGNIKFDAIPYDNVGNHKYKVQEVSENLNGITYDERVFNVTVNVSDDGNGNLVAKVIYPEEKILFENKVIKGSVEITKIDYENGKYLENAEITIRDSEGKIVATGKTDKNGKVLFEGLEYGKYTYEETKAPQGYILDNNKYSFEIKEDGVVVKYTMTNKKAPVVITNTNNSNTPNTGDAGIATSLVILILGVGGLFINNKRRIKNKIS